MTDQLTLPNVDAADIEETFDGAPLSAYRLAASALLTYAVAGHSRSTSDPVYLTIVEGRTGAKYSSCGDLAHWLMYRLGVRAPWINRAENKPPGWRVGLNLNLLAARPVGSNDDAKPARKLTEIPDFGAGDVFQIANVWGGHEICITGAPDLARTDKTAPLMITTAEYGQPGGAAKTHVLTLHKDSGLLFCDSNQVTFYLKLEDALRADGRVAPDLRLVDEAIVEVFQKANPTATA